MFIEFDSCCWCSLSDFVPAGPTHPTSDNFIALSKKNALK